MPSIKENLQGINKKIEQTADTCGRNPDHILLIAVSKKKSAEMIMECINAGHTHFGENYIQEAVEKIEKIGTEKVTWHFIGHLQSNKAKLAVKYFEYIHTVDSLKLAKEINKWAGKLNKIQKVLLQVNIADEQTKSGTSNDAVMELALQVSELENLEVEGLMCMPPFFDEPELARPYFRALVAIQDQIKDSNINSVSMDHLSMGMSGDFAVAIEEGSTMVRVGTSIFGSRF